MNFDASVEDSKPIMAETTYLQCAENNYATPALEGIAEGIKK
jgi:hypothetical protein